MDTFIVSAGVISDAPSISDILANILGFLLSVAGAVAIIALVIAALRFFLIRGDVKQAASIKKSLLAIIFGLLAIFAAIIIAWQIGRILE